MGMSGVAHEWEAFWSSVDSSALTPWDTAIEEQISPWFRQVRDWLPTGLPLIDVACGNGNQTRWLATQFDTPTYGVDVSAAAIGHARALQAEHGGRVDYRVLDILDSRRVRGLAGEIGPAVVCARFLLHHLPDTTDRRAAITGLAVLAGHQGRVLDVELVAPDAGQLAAYAQREPVMQAVLRAGLRPGQLGHTEIVRLYHHAGLRVEAFAATTFTLTRSRPDHPRVTLPVEWVIAHSTTSPASSDAAR
jgi:2-polyprenyl-3-methyl-5-hydroxy-6-metoxy-1,4-benzoquinol methylase